MAGLREVGRVAGRERVRHRLVLGAVAIRDAEGRERLQEGRLRLGQRHAVLRPPRAREARLDVAEVELDDLRVLRRRVRVVEEALHAAVGLDELDLLRAPPREAQVPQRLLVHGEEAALAPYSGDMFPMVARSASGRPTRPWPKYSTNFPTTPRLRRICVTARTRSVAVAPSGSLPLSRKPTTCGTSIETGSPRSTASASIPPTPQPSTPRPLTIVVCESVPISVSGNANGRPPSSRARRRARGTRGSPGGRSRCSAGRR